MRLYRMLPGHGNKGGKLYSFLGKDGLRKGQRVVAPYRHWMSGKINKTMWTIMNSNDVDNPYAVKEIDRLAKATTKGGRDTQLRLIEGTDIMSLPSADDYSSKWAWSRKSNKDYKEEVSKRLAGDKKQTDTSEAMSRLLEG